MKLKRRFFLLLPALPLVLTVMALLPGDTPGVWTSAAQPLQEMEQIRKAIKAPVFGTKVYDITGYGAKGDGVTDNTTAFKGAIEACNAAGGGRC